MVTLLMQGPWLLPGGWPETKESHLAHSDTLSCKDSLWISWCGQKTNTKKPQNKHVLLLFLLSGCCHTGSHWAYFCLWRRAFWGRFIQVALLQGLHLCFCQRFTPTRINVSGQHLIGILYQTSSMALCIILFALIPFVNMFVFKPPKRLCRWLKWGREAKLNMLVTKLCVTHM